MLPLAPGVVAFLAAGYNYSTAVLVATAPNASRPTPLTAPPPPPPRWLTPHEQPPAVARLAAPRLVQFASGDGLFTLHGQLFEARGGGGGGEEGVEVGGSGDRGGRGGAGGGAPAVIFTHGGSQRQMYAALHPSEAYAQLYALNQWLADHGANVLSLNYRSGVGYGRAFRLCEGGNTSCGWQV